MSYTRKGDTLLNMHALGVRNPGDESHRLATGSPNELAPPLPVPSRASHLDARLNDAVLSPVSGKFCGLVSAISVLIVTGPLSRICARVGPSWGVCWSVHEAAAPASGAHTTPIRNKSLSWKNWSPNRIWS